MAQDEESLVQRLSEIETRIANTENCHEISRLNIEAMNIKRELGMPLDN